MAWSIAEVAQMSGVTSRTLRHYDDIGLLKPAFLGTNGCRFYELGDLLRLQQILVLRELGVGLADIGAILDADADPLSALRRHHARLVAEGQRIVQLLATVARTIAQLEQSDQGGADVATTPSTDPRTCSRGSTPPPTRRKPPSGGRTSTSSRGRSPPASLPSRWMPSSGR